MAIMIVTDDSRLDGRQQLHVNQLARDFVEAMVAKYSAGQVEHGGNLWEMDEDRLLDHAINEAIDQVVYLLTIKGKRRGDWGKR